MKRLLRPALILVNLWLTPVVAFSLLPCSAMAQSSPGIVFGQVPTAAQWNAFFAAKQDVLGYVPLNTQGGTMFGPLITSPATSTQTGFNIPPGTAPGSPNNGDMWMTSVGLFARINGVTQQLTGAGSGSFTASNPLAVSFPSAGVVNYALNFNSTLALDGSNNLGINFAKINTWPAAQIFNPNTLTIAGVTSGTSIIDAPSTGGGTATLFQGTDTFMGVAATQSPTNKTIAGSTNTLGGVTMTLGSDATGDIYYRNSSGILTRLPIGSSANVLTVSGGLPAWASAPGGGNVSNTGTPTSGQIAQWTNVTTVQGVNLASLLTQGAGISIAGTTSPTIALSLTNATLQANPTSSQTFTTGNVMLGVGTTCKITPVYSTRVFVHFNGTSGNTSASTLSTFQLRFGTGTAPSAGTAASGTQIGNNLVVEIQTASTQANAIPLEGIITGLTPGTQIWIDVSADANVGTGSVGNLSCTAIEF